MQANVLNKCVKNEVKIFPLQNSQYGYLRTPLDLSNQFWGGSDPGGPNLGPRAFWRQIQKSAHLSQNPTIWVSVDSPGPQQSQFDIFELTWTSRVP